MQAGVLMRSASTQCLSPQVYEIERVKPEERAPVPMMPVAPVMPGMPGALRTLRCWCSSAACRRKPLCDPWLGSSPLALASSPAPSLGRHAQHAAAGRPAWHDWRRGQPAGAHA